MNFFEQQIERCERRIKRINENPDAKRFQSSALLFELERDTAAGQLLAVREGRPIAGAYFMGPLLRAMGFEYVHLMLPPGRASAARRGRPGVPDRPDSRPGIAIDTNHFNRKLEDFIDLCLQNKGAN